MTTATVDDAPAAITTTRVYRELRIAVVIPAFNERRKIADTVATVPELVDHVIVVDDASHDDTVASGRARRAAPRRAGAASR